MEQRAREKIRAVAPPFAVPSASACDRSPALERPKGPRFSLLQLFPGRLAPIDALNLRGLSSKEPFLIGHVAAIASFASSKAFFLASSGFPILAAPVEALDADRRLLFFIPLMRFRAPEKHRTPRSPLRLRRHVLPRLRGKFNIKYIMFYNNIIYNTRSINHNQKKKVIIIL